MYVKVRNDNSIQYPYTTGDLRRDYPEVSFPSIISEDILSAFSVYPIKETQVPFFDRMTETLLPAKVELIDGVWTQKWETIKISEYEASNNVRLHRNKLLSETDWTQLPDSPVDVVSWAGYRQQLRDITTQEGFPWTVIWPQRPTP